MRMISAATTAALALLGLVGCDGASTDTVYLGVAGPLEQPNGRSMRLAADMAAAEINARGGIGGRPLELVFKDDQAHPERAMEVAAELRDDARVSAVVGHVNSAATLAAARIYNDPENGVVELSPASSSPAVTHAGPWTFRLAPSDLQHGPSLAGWAYDRLGARRAEVVYANDDYGRGVLQTFERAFRELGGEVVGTDPYLPDMFESEDALDPYLRRALGQDMDVLVLAGQAEAGARIIAAARRLGYDGPVVGADGLTGLKDAGSLAEGAYVSSAFLPDQPGDRAQAFVQAYQQRYGELPDHRGAMTYDAIYLLAQAIAAAGSDRQAVRDYLDRVGESEAGFHGVAGRVTFDENGDVAEKTVAIGVVRDGRLVTAAPAERPQASAQRPPASAQ